MHDVTIAVARPGAGLLAKYDGQLVKRLPTFAPDSDLIPAADLPQLTAAINATLIPATGRQIAETLAMIAGAWPHAHQKADPTVLDLYARQFAEDFSGFPPDIMVDTVRHLRRTLRFAPSIAELYQVASEKLMARTRQLAILDEHRRAHAHRTIVAQAEAQERRDMQARFDRYVVMCGVECLGWSVADFESATHAMRDAGLSTQWTNAVDAGEPWVAAAAPLAAIAGRVIALLDREVIRSSEAAQLIMLIRRDQTRAADLVAALEAGIAPSEWANEDDTLLWGNPGRHFVDLMNDVRRQHASAIGPS